MVDKRCASVPPQTRPPLSPKRPVSQAPRPVSHPIPASRRFARGRADRMRRYPNPIRPGRRFQKGSAHEIRSSVWRSARLPVLSLRLPATRAGWAANLAWLLGRPIRSGVAPSQMGSANDLQALAFTCRVGCRATYRPLHQPDPTRRCTNEHVQSRETLPWLLRLIPVDLELHRVNTIST